MNHQHSNVSLTRRFSRVEKARRHTRCTLSLTPRFSGVVYAQRSTTNRFNGFAIHSLAIFTLCFFAASEVHAQFPGQGGFGGFPGAGGTSSRSRTTRQYPNNGVGDATFSIDPETRSLIIVADPDTTRYISEVISNLDRPKPQVLIKVVFLEVTHNDASDIGLEGSFSKNTGGSFASGLFSTNFTLLNPGTTNFAIVPNSINPVQNNNIISGSHLFGPGAAAGSTLPTAAGLYQVLGQEYQVTLHAIAQSGKARVLSRPSIIARNNQPATILVGQTVPLITSVRYDTFGNAINGIQYTDVGIILRVTPFITKDGMVEMILTPEISSVSKTDSTPLGSATNSVNAPFIDKRSADTVVITPDGATVIIGGMIQTSKAESENKVPFLGDIPLLGNLFKRKFKTDVNTELLIFLTPHIIQAPSEMAALTATERAKSAGPKAFTEQELNKFLDSIPNTDGQKPNSKHK
jgi:general secretion pathway protein D